VTDDFSALSGEDHVEFRVGSAKQFEAIGRERTLQGDL
jgi:hypothetical protein